MKKTGYILLIIICVFVAGLGVYITADKSDQSNPTAVTGDYANTGYIAENAELEQIDIIISGLTEESNLLFITDNQTNFDEREDLGWFGNRDARTFRNANGDASADHLKDWIDYANNSATIHALVLGGDTMDYFTETNATNVKEILGSLQKPYIYSYGNHDSYIPWENRFDDDNPLFKQFFIDNDLDCQTLDMGQYLIVGIKNYQDGGQSQISQAALDGYHKAVESGKPIILVCHVPICTPKSGELKQMVLDTSGDTYIAYDAGEQVTVMKAALMGFDMGYELTDETKQFIDEVTASDSPVKLVLSGHLHSQWQGYIGESTYEYVGAGAFEDKAAIIHIKGE